MRKIAVVGAAVLAAATMAGQAWGADPSGSSWQGGYVGAFGGYGFGKDNATGGFGDPDIQTEPKGWIAGGQLGFNWAYGDTAVVGVEGAIALTGLTATGTGTFAAPPASIGSSTVTQTLDQYGLFRARVGADVGGVLPYVSGGVAFGKATRGASGSGCTPPNPPVCSASESKTFTGWTAGGGLEVAVGPHWSVRGDYAYIDFGTQNFKIPGPAGGSNVHLTASAVTGSLNVRW